MYFISQVRYNPSKQCDDKYYRIKESYRDALGKVHSYILLNVCFIDAKFQGRDIGDIVLGLTYLSQHKNESSLFDNTFENYSPLVVEHIYKLWHEILDTGKIDVAKKSLDVAKGKARQMIAFLALFTMMVNCQWN